MDRPSCLHHQSLPVSAQLPKNPSAQTRLLPSQTALSVFGNPTMLTLCCCSTALRMKPSLCAVASEPLQSDLYPALQLHFVPLDTTPSGRKGSL